MPDVFTPAKRSEVMSLIRGKNTSPERVVRSMLHSLGYRFTVNGPKNRQLPGKPDIVLSAYRTVIFVHGCFWHAHKNCEYFRLPKTRREWWRTKLKNKERDARVERALTEAGWDVVTIWECATRTTSDREWLLKKLPGLIG